MKKIKITASALLLTAGIVLSGCVQTLHNTPMEMKQDNTIHKESKIVNRSFSKVASTFQRMAPRCLDTTIRISGSPMAAGAYKFTPKIKRSANQITLTLQRKDLGIVVGPSGPEDGIFSLIVDAVPAGVNKTKITIYEREYYTAPPQYKDAIIGWATGEMRGCPIVSLL